MEALFRELLETNKEILNEIKLLRRELAAHRADVPPVAPEPARQLTPPAQAPWQEPDRPARARASQMPDPADFGLHEPAKTPPPRYSAQDLEDLRGALLDGVKQRNKEKRDAFAEFEKRYNR